MKLKDMLDKFNTITENLRLIITNEKNRVQNMNNEKIIFPFIGKLFKQTTNYLEPLERAIKEINEIELGPGAKSVRGMTKFGEACAG